MKFEGRIARNVAEFVEIICCYLPVAQTSEISRLDFVCPASPVGLAFETPPSAAQTRSEGQRQGRTVLATRAKEENLAQAGQHSPRTQKGGRQRSEVTGQNNNNRPRERENNLTLVMRCVCAKGLSSSSLSLECGSSERTTREQREKQ